MSVLKKRRLSILQQRADLRLTYESMRQQWVDKDDARRHQDFPGWVKAPLVLPPGGGRLSSLPPAFMVMQVQHQRGIEADGEYSRIMRATGAAPTAVQLVQLGAASSNSARRRWIKRFKEQAEAAYAEAVVTA